MSDFLYNRIKHGQPATLYGKPVVPVNFDTNLGKSDDDLLEMFAEVMRSFPQPGDVYSLPPGAVRYEGTTENADGTRTLRFTVLDEPEPDAVVESNQQ